MPLYQYSAVSSTGQSIQGKYTAKDRNEILQMLREKQYYPVMINDTAEGKDIKSLGFLKKVKIKDLAVFCRQFYAMLNSGVTIIKCLDILTQQTENKIFRSIIAKVYEEVQKGSVFSEALKNHRDVFPELLINMVEAGEVSGRLDSVMEKMASYFDKEYKIRNKIRSAMIYPIVLSIVACAVVIFLLTAVMPTFIGMFESSGVSLPGPTRILLAFSKIIRSFWYLIFPGIIVIIYLARGYLKSDKGKYAFDRLKLRMPGVKGTVKKIITSRFTRTLSTLLTSGIPLMQAMDVVARVAQNRVVSEGIMNVREDLKKGSDLSSPIRRLAMFPPMVDSMIKIGEESGTLDEILEKTANFYDEEVEVALQRMVTLLEPLLIVFMAFIVGFIVISIAMPMFDMMQTVK